MSFLNQRKNTTNFKYYKYLDIGLLVVLVCIGNIYGIVPTVQAQTMSNKNYIIQTEGIDQVSNATITTTNSKQSSIDPSVSEGVNFKVRTGFENIASTLPFSVSLS